MPVSKYEAPLFKSIYTLDLSSSCLLVQPFGVPLLYNMERSVDEDLNKA
jgi:hypothetical protein